MSKIDVSSRLQLISQKNKYWLEKFRDSLNEQNKKEDTIYQYYMLLIPFLEFNPNIDVNKMSIDDIQDYLGSQKLSDNRINFSITVIKNFFEYLNNQIPINISLEEFNKLRISHKEIEKRNTIPLTVNEIVKIRNILKDDITRLFIFEMVYQYGLSLNQMEQITPDKYNPLTKELKLESKSIILTKKVVSLIQQSSKILSKRTKYNVQDIISEIGAKISRSLVWRDIIQTRKDFFFRCSLCSSKYENTPDNWAMIQHPGHDDTLWIICRNCALKEAKRNE